MRGYYDGGVWIPPNPFNTIGEVVPHLTVIPVVGAPVICDDIISRMGWIIDTVNETIHWPSTWFWPLRIFGRLITDYYVGEFTRELEPYPISIPVFGGDFPDDGVPGPSGDALAPIGDPPEYLILENPLTIGFVENVSRVVVNITTSTIDWLRDWIPNWFGWRESLIARFLTPIVTAARAAYEWSLGGLEDIDEDGFSGEDDERETIVRSVSNLITTRSDRFEIVSIGSVWRANEKLASSRMRVIVCRIPSTQTPPESPIILHFERR